MTYLDILKIGWPIFTGVVAYSILIAIIHYIDPFLVYFWLPALMIIIGFLAGIGVYHNFEKYSKDL